MSNGNRFHQLDHNVKVALQIKLFQLQREGMIRLTLDQLIDTISGLRWRKRLPSQLNEQVDDIFKTSKEDIVIFLSKKAIIDGYSSKISDFEDLIGG